MSDTHICEATKELDAVREQHENEVDSFEAIIRSLHEQLDERLRAAKEAAWVEGVRFARGRLAVQHELEGNPYKKAGDTVARG